MNAVIITLDRTEAMDQALLAGWDIVAVYPSHYPGPMGGPSASSVVVLRGQVTGCDGGIVDLRKGERPPQGVVSVSASSKLKALAVEHEADHGWDSGPYGIAQRDVEEFLAAALPQFVAVVEAAEPFARVSGSPNAAKVAESYRLIAALEELDRALS